jgi:FAD/FMN-containing dehydrogenase
MVTTQTVRSTHPLQEQVSGSVITPDHPQYDTVRRGWNLVIDHHPALILVAHTPHDVVAGVRFARAEGLGVAVQSTGHGIQHPADGALLIVTSEMNAVHIDPDAQTARVEAGAVWHQVVDAAAPFGLAPLLGSSPHVGVVGYTLGGGVGWLARRYGLAADSVHWIDIVTADGVLRRVDERENHELFWGMRGGGGNFGVVVAMGFRLYPVASLYGSNLVYPGDLAETALRFYRDWVTTVPDELTSSIAVLKFPDVSQMPQGLRGQVQVILRAAYIGEEADGEALIRPWLEWKTPLQNTFRQMPFKEVGTISNDPVQPTAGYGSNEMFDTLTDRAIAIIVHHATNPASPLVTAELRHVGGAVSRQDGETNAIGNRDAQFYFQMGGPIFSADGKAASSAYIRQFSADLKGHTRGSVYQNFMSGSEALPRTKDAYSPETLQRLRTLKLRYDPDNRFHFSYGLVDR